MKGREVTILVVEDDDGDIKTVRRAFSKAGIVNSLVRAVDGVQALEILRGTEDTGPLQPPYIILVDINMPRMNGLDFVKALREDVALQRSIIFIMTTSKHDADKCAAYDLNVAGYILKENAGADFLDFVQLIGGFTRIVEMPQGRAHG
jgi:CheY-like chemotaxis protein